MPKEKISKDELPGTIARSPSKAQRTWKKAHDSAVETYGDGERAHRSAYSALKHQFEKVGDHWEPKDGKGPSDPQAKGGAGQPERKTYGGVDVESSTKQELYERAKQLDITGRSNMSKGELAERIAQKQD